MLFSVFRNFIQVVMPLAIKVLRTLHLRRPSTIQCIQLCKESIELATLTLRCGRCEEFLQMRSKRPDLQICNLPFPPLFATLWTVVLSILTQNVPLQYAPQTFKM